MSDEPEMRECPNCGLSFYVVFARDFSSQTLKEYPDQFCPRCGDEMEEAQ